MSKPWRDEILKLTNISFPGYILVMGIVAPESSGEISKNAI